MPLTKLLRMSIFLILLVLVNAPDAQADPLTIVAEAKRFLAQRQPARAILILEAGLAEANGKPEYLVTLAEAYEAEIQELKQANAPAAVVAELQRKRALLPPSKSATSEAADKLNQGIKLYQLGVQNPEKFAEAAKYFSAAFRKVEMTPEQTAAWVYCRLRLANEQLKKHQLVQNYDEIVSEIEDALTLVPSGFPKLQEVGEQLLAVAKSEAAQSNREPPIQPLNQPHAPEAEKYTESRNFRWVGTGTATEVANILAQAEQLREAMYRRWNPQAKPADWQVKCELGFAQPNQTSGLAEVELNNGVVIKRTLLIHAKEQTQLGDCFRRDLTHHLLADLFPMKAPPRWVEVGVAANHLSEEEQKRYRTRFKELARTRSLMNLDQLTAQAELPKNEIVSFHVQSASLVQFLLLWRGESVFLDFLRDSQRYGFASAMQKHYGPSSTTELEQAWHRAALAE